MALNIASYPNKYDSQNPLQNAYAYINFLAVDPGNNAGRISIAISPNANAASTNVPISIVSVSLGEVLTPGNPLANPPVAPVTFPTLDEMLADVEFAQAFGVIESKLYAALLNVPSLSGSSLKA